MEKTTNCPNCGANEIKDGKCAYCGTQINDTKDMEEKIAMLELEKQSVMTQMACLRTTEYLTSMLNGGHMNFNI